MINSFLKSILVVVVLSPLTAQAGLFSGGSIQLGRNLCINERNEQTRFKIALQRFESAYQAVTGDSVSVLSAFDRDKDLSKILNRKQFHDLTKSVYSNVMMNKINQKDSNNETVANLYVCGFTNRARFDTVNNYLNSITNELYQTKNSKDYPGWLKPGFKAVIKGDNSDASIFIETTSNGFIFHDCEGDDGIRTVNQPLPSEKCPMLMTSQIFIPVDRLMHNTLGILDGVWTVLKALSSASLIFLSGAPDFGLYATAAQATVNIIQPNPASDFTNKRFVRNAIQKTLEFGELSAELDDNNIVTKIIPTDFTTLKTALMATLRQINKEMIEEADKIMTQDPYNPNVYLLPGYVIQKNVHDEVNRQYKEANKPVEVAPIADAKPELGSTP